VEAVLAGGRSFNFGSSVTPSFPSLIVIVPTDLPTPSAVMRFIVTLIDLAAYAGATKRAKHPREQTTMMFHLASP
jgi:hypothetical protein